MRLALAQIDPFIGDFEGNTAKILRFIDKAKKSGCDMVIFPEMALIGYPPKDLVEKSGFVRKSKEYWPQIMAASRGIAVVCGVITENTSGYGKSYHNSAAIFVDGALHCLVHKMLLPSYDVFDEARYFEPAKQVGWLDFKGKRMGITVCEDVWNVPEYLPHPPYPCDPVKALKEESIEILINIAASPYHVKKAEWVGNLLQFHAVNAQVQVVFVNQVGGNDELIFQGHSMVYAEDGRLVVSGADFEEDLMVYDAETRQGEFHSADLHAADEVTEALVLGLRDYARKCGFGKVVIGLSGGIDSALTACLAVLALGSENVLTVAMPGPYNAPESLEDAHELARRLNVQFEVVPITELFDAVRKLLSPIFGNLPVDVTEENIQARLRGLLLMALSNKFNRLLLSTGNKSELAVGYATLYGDMNGGLAVLGDVPKTMVYDLAARLNDRYGWIPRRIITRAPSAELSPGQTDQDSLPPYDVLDAILSGYVEKRLSVEEIAALGLDKELVASVVRRVDNNEYKRWQAPPVLRVTSKAFGTGRRFPIAKGYRDE